MTDSNLEVERVLDFWLGDARLSAEHAVAQKKLWYRSSDAIDHEIKTQFLSLHERACHHQLDSWRTTPEACLALVIVLDQFSRHLFRGTPQAFAYDDLALEIARECPEPTSLPFIGRAFLLHPFEHTEHRQAQEESAIHFKQLVEDADDEWRPMMEEFYQHALEHQSIVFEFGRFPHRNEILDRTSSPEELAFLAKSGRTFGQTKSRANKPGT